MKALTPSQDYHGLVIEHGGVRGIMPARLLQEIETRTGQPISRLFDLLVTTSTGAISAAMLSLPAPGKPDTPYYTARDVVNVHLKESETAFPREKSGAFLRQIFGEAKHDPRPFEGLLARTLGNALVSDSLTDIMILAVELETGKLVRITNTPELAHATPCLSGMKLRDAVRGATTAPTYYPAGLFERLSGVPQAGYISVIDGAFGSGNMLHEAYHLLSRRASRHGGRVILTHLGTGAAPPETTRQDYNQQIDGINGVRKKLGHFLRLAFGAASQASTEFMQMYMKDDFFDFNPLIDAKNHRHPSGALDDSSPGNIRRLLMHAENFIDRNDKALDGLCAALARRQKPARSAALAHQP